MASEQMIQIQVRNESGVLILDDTIRSSENAQDLFTEINSRCAFGTWDRVVAFVYKRPCTIYNLWKQGQDDLQYAQQGLKMVISYLQASESVVTCKIKVRVQVEEDIHRDGPAGPDDPDHAGIAGDNGPVPRGEEDSMALGGVRAHLERMRALVHTF